MIPPVPHDSVSPLHGRRPSTGGIASAENPRPIFLLRHAGCARAAHPCDRPCSDLSPTMKSKKRGMTGCSEKRFRCSDIAPAKAGKRSRPMFSCRRPSLPRRSAVFPYLSHGRPTPHVCIKQPEGTANGAIALQTSLPRPAFSQDMSLQTEKDTWIPPSPYP